jgi:hypothetical protein
MQHGIFHCSWDGFTGFGAIQGAYDKSNRVSGPVDPERMAGEEQKNVSAATDEADTGNTHAS